MKLSKIFLPFVAILLSLQFTSCTKYSYEIKRGTLNFSSDKYPNPPVTDKSGYFGATFNIDAADVSIVDLRREYVTDVISYRTKLWLKSSYFRPTDVIPVTLRAYGLNPCTVNFVILGNDGYADLIENDAYLFDRFMENFIRQLARRGNLDLEISGRIPTDTRGVAIDIISENNFDVEVRYDR